MDAVNWLLINGADALFWLGGLIKILFSHVFTVLDAVLNPVLSPILAVLNPVFTEIADGLYFLLAPFPVWVGLTILSVVAGVIMLIAFRYTSNQAAIGKAKDDIKANLLALKEYYFGFVKNGDVRVIAWLESQVEAGDIVVCDNFSMAMNLKYHWDSELTPEFVAWPRSDEGGWHFSEEIRSLPEEPIEWTISLDDVLS